MADGEAGDCVSISNMENDMRSSLLAVALFKERRVVELADMQRGACSPRECCSRALGLGLIGC